MAWLRTETTRTRDGGAESSGMCRRGGVLPSARVKVRGPNGRMTGEDRQKNGRHQSGATAPQNGRRLRHAQVTADRAQNGRGPRRGPTRPYLLTRQCPTWPRTRGELHNDQHNQRQDPTWPMPEESLRKGPRQTQPRLASPTADVLADD